MDRPLSRFLFVHIENIYEYSLQNHIIKVLNLILHELSYRNSKRPIALSEKIKEDLNKINKNAFGKNISFSSKYIGDFKNNIKHGVGAYFFSNGDIFLGSWENNKIHGYGYIYCSSGDIYKGNWRYGYKHGNGKLIKENSQWGIFITEQFWSNNKLIKEKSKKLENFESYKQNTEDNFSTDKEVVLNKNQKQNSRMLPKLPKVIYLRLLSWYGIDKAFTSLSLESHRKSISGILESVTKFRPRYSKIDKSIFKKKYFLDSFLSVNPILVRLPFKFFLYPVGRGKFINLKNDLDRTFLIQDVIEHLNKRYTFNNHHFKDVSDFDHQAISSLIFHSQICSSFSDVKEESDILDYVFKIELSKQNLIEFFLENYSKNINKDEILKCIDEIDNTSIAFNNLTIDLIKQIKNWQNTTFDQIFNLSSELPKRLKLSKERVALNQPHYPKIVQRLSIFTLSSITSSNSLLKKIEILNRLGARRIQDLIIFSNIFRPLLKDKKFQERCENFKITAL